MMTISKLRSVLSTVRYPIAAFLAAGIWFSQHALATPPAQVFTWINSSRAVGLASNFGERESYWFARLLSLNSTRCPKSKYGHSFKCLSSYQINQAIQALICPSYHQGKKKIITTFLNRLNSAGVVRSYHWSRDFRGKARVAYRLASRAPMLEMAHWQMKRGKKHVGYSVAQYLSCSQRNPNLKGANLSNMDLKGADLRGADLRGARLTGADLRNSKLNGADLRRALFRETNLSGANLRGTNLNGAVGLTRKQIESARRSK